MDKIEEKNSLHQLVSGVDTVNHTPKQLVDLINALWNFIEKHL